MNTTDVGELSEVGKRSEHTSGRASTATTSGSRNTDASGNTVFGEHMDEQSSCNTTNVDQTVDVVPKTMLFWERSDLVRPMPAICRRQHTDFGAEPAPHWAEFRA